MNLFLLTAAQITDNVATINGRQLEHLLKVQRAEIGDSVRVGVVNGLMGQAIITTLDTQQATLQIILDTPPPAITPLDADPGTAQT